MADPQRHLVRALLARAGGEAVLLGAASRDWASVTFVGRRYVLEFSAEGEAAERLADGLGEEEFAVPGYLVADIAVTAREGTRLTIEALLLEEA